MDIGTLSSASSYLLAAALLTTPATHHAVHEEVSGTSARILPAAQAQKIASSVDKVMEEVASARQAIAKKSTSQARADLDAAQQALDSIRRDNLSKLVTIRFWARHDSAFGYEDASQDLMSKQFDRLDQVESDLRQGKSRIAARELSRVPYPFVYAALHLPIKTVSADVQRALKDLTSKHNARARSALEQFDDDVIVDSSLFGGDFTAPRRS